MTNQSDDMVPVVYSRPKRVRRSGSVMPAVKLKRLKAARMIDFEGLGVDVVAKFYERDEKTIYRWAAEAREYPEYETLRRNAAS